MWEELYTRLLSDKTFINASEALIKKRRVKQFNWLQDFWATITEKRNTSGMKYNNIKLFFKLLLEVIADSVNRDYCENIRLL